MVPLHYVPRNMEKKAQHPQWAIAQKKPGTELRCIRGKYYLYECSSFYDKELKKTRKKTGKYLGMITEERGLVPPRKRQVEIENETVCAEAAAGHISCPEPKVGQVKEYGLSTFISEGCGELISNLKASMPTMWNRVLAMAYCRLRSQSPLKYIQDDFNDSYLTQTLGTAGLSARSLTDFLKTLGKGRDQILDFMRRYALVFFFVQ